MARPLPDPRQPRNRLGLIRFFRIGLKRLSRISFNRDRVPSRLGEYRLVQMFERAADRHHTLARELYEGDIRIGVADPAGNPALALEGLDLP